MKADLLVEIICQLKNLAFLPIYYIVLYIVVQEECRIAHGCGKYDKGISLLLCLDAMMGLYSVERFCRGL